MMVMRVPAELLDSVEMHWIQRLRPELNKLHPGRQSSSPMIRVNYRFQPSTVKALQKVARKNKITQTEFVEQAVIEKIERSGIIKPEKEDAS